MNVPQAVTPITWKCRVCGVHLPALAIASELAEINRIAGRNPDGTYPGICREHEGTPLPIPVVVTKGKDHD